ncbi:unnamed protein product [Echinostoma caproni]|uniref:Transcriptional regulator ICP22 homolog n=1 Tax=Echinostoma caproni TaxID=27848 RepID=A0A183BBF7_9TREM|nr:unnamed protein product [Echinostoma caproni]
MTERRRLQLERIRAMAAELRPTRPRGSKSGPTRSASGRGSRGGQSSGVARGQGRGGRGSRGSGRLSNAGKSANRTPRRHLSDTEDMDTCGLDEASTALPVADDWDDVDIARTPSPTWDIDTEENSNMAIDPDASNVSKIGAVRPDTELYMDPGDESEGERDQLAVLDTLLTLYDPEASRDIGCAGLSTPLEQFYQIHVNTELPR